MLECFTSHRAGAIPITPVDAAALPQWLDAHPESREWVAAVGFKAEPGTFAFLAGNGGRPSAVLASPMAGESVWAFSGLATTLPEGSYALESGVAEASWADAALGWALGSYAFSRYKKPKRAPAMLVWPANADRTEVERIAQAVHLARDLINTPAEDMGPEELADAALSVSQHARSEDAGHRRRRSSPAELSDDPHRRARERARASAHRPALGRRGRAEGHARRQGRVLRHRRPRSKAARRHAGDEEGHGRRRGHAGAGRSR